MSFCHLLNDMLQSAIPAAYPMFKSAYHLASPAGAALAGTPATYHLGSGDPATSTRFARHASIADGGAAAYTSERGRPQRVIPGEAMARRAAALVQDGSAVGLGTGRAASAFLGALADRVRRGLQVRCVATSRTIEAAARDLALSLVSLDEIGELDIDVDGADEIDPALDLIKGYGGALVRERIVAEASRRLVILAGTEKLVANLGARGVLPVEVVPFGWAPCARRLGELGCPSRRRMDAGAPFVTDNGNNILDCVVQPIADPAALQREIGEIPGVVGTGLFLGMADTVFIEDARGNVTERQRA